MRGTESKAKDRCEDAGIPGHVHLLSVPWGIRDGVESI